MRRPAAAFALRAPLPRGDRARPGRASSLRAGAGRARGRFGPAVASATATLAIVTLAGFEPAPAAETPAAPTFWSHPDTCAETGGDLEQLEAICARETGASYFGEEDAPVAVSLPPSDGTFDVCAALESARAGDADAARSVAGALRRGIGLARDMCAAARWAFEAAQRGDAAAMTLLGAHYELGDGVPRDPQSARLWYERAAARGDARALTRLGALFRDGRGVARDRKRAFDYFRQAADLGDPAGMMALADLHVRGDKAQIDFKRALDWSRRAAETGHAPAMAQRAALEIWGRFLARKKSSAVDCAGGLEWARRAEAAGVGVGAALIGDAHLLGCGLFRNVREAARWYRRAAELGAPVSPAFAAALFGAPPPGAAEVAEGDASETYAGGADAGEAEDGTEAGIGEAGGMAIEAGEETVAAVPAQPPAPPIRFAPPRRLVIGAAPKRRSPPAALSVGGADPAPVPDRNPDDGAPPTAEEASVPARPGTGSAAPEASPKPEDEAGEATGGATGAATEAASGTAADGRGDVESPLAGAAAAASGGPETPPDQSDARNAATIGLAPRRDRRPRTPASTIGMAPADGPPPPDPSPLAGAGFAAEPVERPRLEPSPPPQAGAAAGEETAAAADAGQNAGQGADEDTRRDAVSDDAGRTAPSASDRTLDLSPLPTPAERPQTPAVAAAAQVPDSAEPPGAAAADHTVAAPEADVAAGEATADDARTDDARTEETRTEEAGTEQAATDDAPTARPEPTLAPWFRTDPGAAPDAGPAAGAGAPKLGTVVRPSAVSDDRGLDHR